MITMTRIFRKIGFALMSVFIGHAAWAAEDVPFHITGIPEDAALKPALLQYQAQLNESPEGADPVAVQDALQKIAKSYGYYDARVEQEKGQERSYILDPGAPYQFANISYQVKGEGRKQIPAEEIQAMLDTVALEGRQAIAESVVSAEQRIKASLLAKHCFFRVSVTHRALLDKGTHRIEPEFIIELGPEAHLRAMRVSGLENVSEDYAWKYIPLKAGACFSRAALNDTRLALQGTGLFSSVSLLLPEYPDNEGNVDVEFALKERPARTIKVGANYSTDIGPGLTAGWEHRNFFSHGEKLSSDLALTPVERSLNTRLEKPFFQRDDQRLKLSALVEQQDSDAYQTTGATVTGQVERSLQDDWKVALGTSYGFKQIKDQQSTKNFALLSLPSYLSKDTRNDVLNPMKGWSFTLDAAPFIDTLGTDLSFFKSRLSGSYYLHADWPGEPVLALRGAAGSIVGVATDDVPATDRFFVGGGGSLRGYSYQAAGPLDAQNDPLGGRSFVESSVELRVRFSEDYGAVAFFDAGNAYDASLPDFEDGLRYGAGVGIRYFTGFGPLRADIAVPLSKRDGVDSDYELYFSIGQAF